MKQRPVTIYSSDIQRACVALQVALLEHRGVGFDLTKELSDDVTLAAIETCADTIRSMTKQYLKKERE
jgi:hypothetical protein